MSYVTTDKGNVMPWASIAYIKPHTENSTQVVSHGGHIGVVRGTLPKVLQTLGGRSNEDLGPILKQGEEFMQVVRSLQDQITKLESLVRNSIADLNDVTTKARAHAAALSKVTSSVVTSTDKVSKVVNTLEQVVNDDVSKVENSPNAE